MSDALPRERICVGCEQRPVRTHGELVTQLEELCERRLYCAPCASDWAESDPDGQRSRIDETVEAICGPEDDDAY